MKYFIAAIVFILTIGLTIKSTANEPEACSSEKTENCTKVEAHGANQSKKAAHAATHESAATEHEGKSAKMNSLFPQPEKNSQKSVRPTTVKLSSPKFLAKIAGDSAKLEWAAADGATSYHVQVATDPNFKWLVANEPWVKTTSFDVNKLEAGKKYFWRVAAVKGENDSMFTKSLFVNSVFQTSTK